MHHVFIDTNIWIRVLSQGRPGCEVEHLDSLVGMVEKLHVGLILPEVVELEFEKAWRDFRNDLTKQIGILELKVDEALKKQVWTEVEDVQASIAALLQDAKHKKVAAAETHYGRVRDLFAAQFVMKVPLTQETMFFARKRLIAGRMPKPENQAFNDACIVESLLWYFHSLPPVGHDLYFCSENVADFGLATKDGTILHPIVRAGLPPARYMTNLRELIEAIRTSAPPVDPPPAVVQEALEQEVAAGRPPRTGTGCQEGGCNQPAWYFGPFCADHLRVHLAALPEGEARRFHETVNSVLQTLTYREREVFRLRTGLGDGFVYTLKECGRIFRCSESTIRRLEARAVYKLSHPARAGLFDAFF